MIFVRILMVLGLLTLPLKAQDPTHVIRVISRSQLIEILHRLNDDEYLLTPDEKGLITDWMAIILPSNKPTKEEFRIAAELALGIIPELNTQGKLFHPCLNGEREAKNVLEMLEELTQKGDKI